MRTRPLTKTQRIARERLAELSWRAQMEDDVTVALRDEVPDAWHRLEADLDVVEKKVQITLRLDESVAKFYRAMGQGYQARISRILETYAQMKIAGALEWEARLEEMMEEGLVSRGQQDDFK